MTSCEAGALQADDWPQLQAIEAQLCAHIDAAELPCAKEPISKHEFCPLSHEFLWRDECLPRARSDLVAEKRAPVDYWAAAEGDSTVSSTQATRPSADDVCVAYLSGVLSKSPKEVLEPCRAAGVPSPEQSSRANGAERLCLLLPANRVTEPKSYHHQDQVHMFV